MTFPETICQLFRTSLCSPVPRASLPQPIDCQIIKSDKECAWEQSFSPVFLGELLVAAEESTGQKKH